MDDLLPIGSVVKTDKIKPLMIIGYYPSMPIEKEFYDYICCTPKIGIITPNSKLKKDQGYYCINHEDIKDILFLGYQTKEYDVYNKMLKEIKMNVLKAKENNNVTDDEFNNIYEEIIQKYMKEYCTKGE